MPKYIAIRQRGANISQAQIEAISTKKAGEIAVVDSDIARGLELLEMHDPPQLESESFKVWIAGFCVGVVSGIVLTVLYHLA